MELSPKQQAVNEIKNAKRVLILGHKKPDGDHLGSVLALGYALEKLEKTVEIIVSDKIDDIYKFLPAADHIKTAYRHTEGKVLKIDTNRIPISGMKWQKEDNFLNIYLETDKNLKFEFIEIENGQPKPDLIIVVDTPDIKSIDETYSKNTDLFFEVPVLNIDHHPGNEYFGTINLVDLTATSTAEILVSLFEALGVKIDTPDMATCLLAGILSDTESFRGKNITPKSLTVAAQLLAAGGRQQEIISNFYKTEPTNLMAVWETLLDNLNVDLPHRLAWTKIDLTKHAGVQEAEIWEAAADLRENAPGSDAVMILIREANQGNLITARIESNGKIDATNIANIFGGSGDHRSAGFEIKNNNLDDAEKIILKKLAESWGNAEGTPKKELWDVIEEKKSVNITEAPTPEIVANKRVRLEDNPTMPNSIREKEDAIEEALKSISQVEKDENRKEFESLRDVIDRKRAGGMRVIESNEAVEEADVFGDE